MAKFVCVLGLCMLLSACFNSSNTISGGELSLGERLGDLKQALDQGALTEAEYTQAKAMLLDLDAMCAAQTVTD